MLERINRELVRIADMSNLTPIDDYSDLKAKTCCIQEIYRLRAKGTKTYPRKKFFTTIYLFEDNHKKASLYAEADKFLTLLEEEFFKEEEEFVFDYEITREGLKKVFSDKGKFYQYSIQLTISVY